MSLTPGTAVAQGSAPFVTGVTVGGDGNDLEIVFNEDLVGSDDLTHGLNTGQISVTVDGVAQTIISVFPGHSVEKLVVTLQVAPPALAVVRVVYDKDLHAHRLRDASGNVLESFTWVVTVPVTTEDVYDALESYFSGTTTLGRVNSVLGAAVNSQTYHEALLEETDKGELHRRFGFGDNPDQDTPGDPTAWGTDEAAGWTQKGSPSHPGADPSLTCGGVGKPALTGRDAGRFFWACTEDNRWVPVKLAQPGVDYSHDADLIRPGRPGYNEMCRFKDEDGNPAPVSRVRRHEDGTYMRDPHTGKILFDTIHGHNWDPRAEYCTGRGGS